ncbi:MAG TPA: DUF2071 domain-containing protein [Streptosporangiaceae bacterium]|nr:DUF2071 domain-containing protein [Streptosporangiaceae bacterium]
MAVSDGVPAGSCPFRIDRPVMRQRWDRLTFLHWRFKPDEVAGLLPPGLEPELFDGAAWVGLVPFFMHVATSGGRMLPWLSRFPETNVRTYVRNADGVTGIWFFSLDAARLGAVAVARTTYQLPYFWSSMEVDGGQAASGGEISYRCHRRLPGPAASSLVRVAIGDRIGADELDERDHFLTARWILFSVARSRRRLARACHQPWPLHRAEATTVDDGLLTAAGLPAPVGTPLVHYSPGVDVAIGRPERCR